MLSQLERTAKFKFGLLAGKVLTSHGNFNFVVSLSLYLVIMSSVSSDEFSVTRGEKTKKNKKKT